MKPAEKIRNTQAANGRIDAEIDRILASEDELVPTSGFMASVMERVEEESTAPGPIPFPWKRAVPALALTAGVFGWGAVELVRSGASTLPTIPLTALHLSAASAHAAESAGWVALALGVSLVSWLVSRRLAGSGGLL